MIKKWMVAIVLVFMLSSCTPEIDIKLLPGQDTVEINTSWEDAGAELSIDDEITTVYSEDTVNTSSIGETLINYSYIDEKGVNHEVTRYVTVTDQTPPVMSLHTGIDTVSVDETWTDSGVTATDNSLEDPSIVIEGTVDTSVAGMYTITYIATDASNNESRITRYVNVLE